MALTFLKRIKPLPEVVSLPTVLPKSVKMAQVEQLVAQLKPEHVTKMELFAEPGNHMKVALEFFIP